MSDVEQMGGREAMYAAQVAVNRELNELHMERRDRDEVIESQQRQIKILREDAAQKEFETEQRLDAASDRVAHEYQFSDDSSFLMCVSWVITLIVLVGAFLYSNNAHATKFTVVNDAPVIGYFAGQSADYDNVLRVAGIGLSAVNGFHNHHSVLGLSINFGAGHAGDEIAFTDQVINTGDMWYSDRSRNSDGQDHLFYSSFSLPDGTQALLVGFEDLKGLGDNDRNDVMGVFTNVQAMAPVPEPETYLMMLFGSLIVFFIISKTNKKKLKKEIAVKMGEAFDGVDLTTQQFKYGGILFDADGEYKFYKKAEIDKAFKKLTDLIKELEK